LTRLNLEIPIYGSKKDINIMNLTDALETISMAETFSKSNSTILPFE